MKHTGVKNNPLVLMHTHIITSYMACFVSYSFIKEPIYKSTSPAKSCKLSGRLVALISIPSYITYSYVFLTVWSSDLPSGLLTHQGICKIIY